MTDFIPQSSDKRRPADNPFNNYVLNSNIATIDTLASTGGTGYVGNVQIDLGANFDLDLIIPDINVWFYYDNALGGGISQRSYEKLPYTELNSSMTIQAFAGYNISFQYDTTKTTTPLSGTTFLSIYYWNRSSSSAGQNFIYHINSTRVANAATTVF